MSVAAIHAQRDLRTKPHALSVRIEVKAKPVRLHSDQQAGRRGKLAQILSKRVKRLKTGLARSDQSISILLKPLSEQTIVITGASSGIGLATAKAAAKRVANSSLHRHSAPKNEAKSRRSSDAMLL
jgi:hypothetical protein